MPENPARTQLLALGELIRAQRQQAELTLRELAARTNVSNPYLSQIERGLHEPSVRVLKAIAGALNLSAESLLQQAGLLGGRGRRHASAAADGRGGGPVRHPPQPRPTSRAHVGLQELRRRQRAAEEEVVPAEPSGEATDVRSAASRCGAKAQTRPSGALGGRAPLVAADPVGSGVTGSSPAIWGQAALVAAFTTFLGAE